MARDLERVESIEEALREGGLDALVCTLPADVLLLTGYWPVIGASVAVAARGPRIVLLVPEDERELAEQGGADEVRTFHPGSLRDLRTTEEAVRGPLGELGRELGPCRRVGHEGGGFTEPAPYSALYLYGSRILDLLRHAFPAAALVPADEPLARLRAVKTSAELARLRVACHVLGNAFEAGASGLRPGLSDADVAEGFRAGLFRGEGRVGGFVWCMSGPDAARAGAAYARTGRRTLGPGELALVHCNSFADGFWTDVTRTFCLGEPDETARRIYDAAFAARAAALDAVRPGAKASAVDRAARSVLTDRGFGEAFPHATGHGVGFGAISAQQRPRLHPASDDVLRPGMAFNVEPAVYLDGYGGLRQCDMVAVTATGAELLTPFQSSPEELILARPVGAG